MAISLIISELSVARPWGFLLWLLPVILLVFLRRRQAPVTRATGTLQIWREIAEQSERPTRGRARRLPPGVWWLVLATLVGGLSVAGPRFESPPVERSWHFDVDRSPSMFLPVAPGDDATRYEVAVRAAIDWLDEAGVPVDARVWRTAGEGLFRGTEPPIAWSRLPVAACPELALLPGMDPPWNRITDRAPEDSLAGIGLFASGGVAVPGVIGEYAGRSLVWDGSHIVEGEAAPRRSLHVGAGVPEKISELASIWAEERGVARADDPREAQLVIAVQAGSPAGVERGVRSAWEIEVRAQDSSNAVVEGEAWLWSAKGDRVLVSHGPGRVDLGFLEVMNVAGDPASFAVDWSELFDGSLLAAADFVPLAERHSAGSNFMVPPRAGIVGSIQVESTPLAAWLALLSTLLAGLAFSARLTHGRELGQQNLRRGVRI